MSAPYTKDADITTDGAKRSNYKQLKNLRLEQRSTESQYECIPRWTRRAHFKLYAADKTVVIDETLIFALYCPSSKIPGGWPGDELDSARQRLNVPRVCVMGNLTLFWPSRGSPTTLRLYTRRQPIDTLLLGTEHLFLS